MSVKHAVETVKEIMARLRLSSAWDEKEAEEAAKKLQPKGSLLFQAFKRFLITTAKDALIMGLLRVEERLWVDQAMHDEMTRWTEINVKFLEPADSHAPVRGSKLKKGVVLRARRRRLKEAANLRAGCDYYAEDARGHIYLVEGAKVTEVEHSAMTPKNLAAFQKLDEERGEKVCDVEKDPMGLTLPHPVLGVDMATAVKNSPGAIDMVPSFLRQCIDYIDQHLEEEGLYRIPGGSRRINEMCFMANQGRPLILEPGDVENCCSVVVRWLRTLPDQHGLLWNAQTRQYRGDFSAAAGNDGLRAEILKRVVEMLPPESKSTLRFLLRHFQRVGEAKNKMTLKTLDICIPGGFDLPSLIACAPLVWDDWETGPPPALPALVDTLVMRPVGPGAAPATAAGNSRSPRSGIVSTPVLPGTGRVSDGAVYTKTAIPSNVADSFPRVVSSSAHSSPTIAPRSVSPPAPRRNTGNGAAAATQQGAFGAPPPALFAPPQISPTLPPSRTPPRSPAASPRLKEGPPERVSPKASPRLSSRAPELTVVPAPEDGLPPPLPDLPVFQPNLIRK